MSYFSKFASIAAITMFFSACGGGDGDSTQPGPVADPNMTVPFKVAYINLINNPLNASFKVSGWVDQSSIANPRPPTPIAGNATLTVSSATAATINGTSYLQQNSSLSMALNGQAPQYSLSQSFYNINDYSIYKTVAGNKTMYYSNFSVPVSVKAGDVGLLATATDGSSFLPTTQRLSYSVASGDITSLRVTVVTDEYSMGNLSRKTQVVYKVKTDGGINIISEAYFHYNSGTLYQSLELNAV